VNRSRWCWSDWPRLLPHDDDDQRQRHPSVSHPATVVLLVLLGVEVERLVTRHT
jgi:hypothetical protein